MGWAERDAARRWAWLYSRGPVHRLIILARAFRPLRARLGGGLGRWVRGAPLPAARRAKADAALIRAARQQARRAAHEYHRTIDDMEKP